MALDVSPAGALVKESAFAFGPVVAEPPTPRAITLKAIEEDIKNTARIFFIVFDEWKFPIFRRSDPDAGT
jgi:hypothetical protein